MYGGSWLLFMYAGSWFLGVSGGVEPFLLSWKLHVTTATCCCTGSCSPRPMILRPKAGKLGRRLSEPSVEKKLEKSRPKTRFYAVALGKSRGVFPSGKECQVQVLGFPGDVYKGFST